MNLTQLLEISGINYYGIVILLFIIIINITASKWLLGCYLHLHPSQKKKITPIYPGPNILQVNDVFQAVCSPVQRSSLYCC